MPLAEPRTKPFNFVVVGPERSGFRRLADCLRDVIAARKVRLHADLLHPNHEVRSRSHLAYFVDDEDDQDQRTGPYVPREESAACYLRERVIDRAYFGETHVGVRLTLSDVQVHQLWGLFEELDKRGGFGLILLDRNPVACYVSLRQCSVAGVFERLRESQPIYFDPVELAPYELDAYCQQYDAAISRLRRRVEYRLEISYEDYDHPYRMAVGLREFFRLDALDAVAPMTLAVTRRSWGERIANLRQLKRECRDARPWLDQLES